MTRDDSSHGDQQLKELSWRDIPKLVQKDPKLLLIGFVLMFALLLHYFGRGVRTLIPLGVIAAVIGAIAYLLYLFASWVFTQPLEAAGVTGLIMLAAFGLAALGYISERRGWLEDWGYDDGQL